MNKRPLTDSKSLESWEHYYYELEDWAEKAEKEIEKLKGLLKESVSNDGESESFDRRVKNALK